MVDTVNEYELDLGKSKKLTVQSFHGRPLVQIREYYEKDGETLPGRKGIALNIDQFRAVVEKASVVLEALESLEGGTDHLRKRQKTESSRTKLETRTSNKVSAEDLANDVGAGTIPPDDGGHEDARD